LVNPLGYLDRICITLFVDGEFDGLLAAHTRDGFAVLVAAFHGSYVAQVYGSFRNVGDDRITKLIDALKFIQCSHEEALIAFLEPAAGQVYVLSPNTCGDLVNTDTELR